MYKTIAVTSENQRAREYFAAINRDLLDIRIARQCAEQRRPGFSATRPLSLPFLAREKNSALHRRRPESLIGVAFLLLHQMVRGFSQSFLDVRNNRYIPPESKNRVTLLSVGNFMSMVLMSVSSFFLGILTGSNALNISILIYGLAFCGGFLLLIWAHQNHRIHTPARPPRFSR